MKEISIVIATYNAAKTLHGCLDSIVSQLNDECELILVDGGSKDDTNKIIDSYGDRIAFHISEPDKGIYDAWNKGVANAKGKWIMFVGADDKLLPKALKTYLNIIHSLKDIDTYDYICAHDEYIDQNGHLLKVLGEEAAWEKMRRYMSCAHVASLHNHHNLFDMIGGYNLNFHICADYELLLRKRDKLKSIFVPNHMAQMEAGGMSFSTKAIIETYIIRKLHRSVPAPVNIALFLRDWLAFKFFILRIFGGKSKIKIANYLFHKVKGQDFNIDTEIPLSYVLNFIFSKTINMIYGMIRLRTTKRIFVSPTSKIICPSKMFFGNNLNIGYKCYINALSFEGLTLGKNVSLGMYTTIKLTGSLQKIGNYIKIGDNVGLGTHGFYGCGMGFLEIGDDTIIGNYVSIHPENHNYKDLSIPIRLQGVNGKGIKIGKNCWIGAKVTILDGTSIGDNCIVAAGAVVKGTFPDNVIIGGVPAKIMKYR